MTDESVNNLIRFLNKYLNQNYNIHQIDNKTIIN